jgi:hypothetical protein
MLATPDPIHRFISIPIPVNFITRLEEYNAIFGQQQIENIYFTISLMKQKNKQDRIDNLVKSNIQKCVAWCTKYNVPYSISVINNNITNTNNTNNYETKLAPPPGLPIPHNLLNQPLSDFLVDASKSAVPNTSGTALLRNVLRL